MLFSSNFDKSIFFIHCLLFFILVVVFRVNWKFSASTLMINCMSCNGSRDVTIPIPYWGIDIGIRITLKKRYLEKLFLFHKV